MPHRWRTIKSLIYQSRFNGRRGKGMAESFSREKLRHTSQKEGGWIRITVVVSHIEKNKNR